MDEIERTLLVKQEVFIYKIPPRTSAKGYRAADWKLDAPDWTVRLRCIVKGAICELRLEDRNNGELFAACPVEHYPGTSVEAVTDSSRYFVICVQAPNGSKAYLGMGFTDRSDSFDLNVTLQDHFKQLKKEDQFSREAVEPPKPNLDLAFKEGQTIRINIPNKPTGATNRPRAGSKGGGLGGFVLPPPPGGGVVTSGRVPASASSGSLASSTVIGGNPSVGDLLGDITPTPNIAAASVPNPIQASATSGFEDDWGDFASTKAPTTQTVASGNWEQF